jgi:hypothetical protein
MDTMSMLDPWYGLRIIVRAYPYREVPVKPHRKKRLAKKWLKRYGLRREYVPVNEREILHDVERGIMYVYPRMEAEVRELMRGRTSA